MKAYATYLTIRLGCINRSRWNHTTQTHKLWKNTNHKKL